MSTNQFKRLVLIIFFFSTDDTFEVKKKTNDTFEVKKTDNTFEDKKTDHTFEVKKPSVRFLAEESRSVLLTNNSGNFVPNATGISEGYATASFMSSTSLQSHMVVRFNDFFIKFIYSEKVTKL